MIYQLIGSGLPWTQIIALIVAYVMALLISFCSHEFSHAYMAYKMGDPTAKALGRLTLNPFKHIDPMGFMCLLLFGFGWAKPVEINPLHFKNYKKSMTLVSLSGVTTNLILAFIFSGIFFFTNGLLVNSTNLFLIFLYYFLLYMILLNLSLFIFNLIPVFPLDGFNFIKAITKPGNKFVEFMQRYGTIMLLIFLITPIFDYVFSYVTSGLLYVFNLFWGLFV